MAQDYFTIKSYATASFIEKKSEFIGDIKPVTTPEEAVNFINEIKNMHKNARHYCYVYILRNDSVLRYSDDGEPQGKAAMPMLEVLKSNGLTDVCLVVTRYFGGILLGGGGLARAYSNGAAIAVNASEIVRMVLCKSITLLCSYSMYDKLSFYFDNFSLSVENIEYSDNVKIYINLVSDEVDSFNELMSDKSFGSCKIEILDEKFSDIPVK